MNRDKLFELAKVAIFKVLESFSGNVKTVWVREE